MTSSACGPPAKHGKHGVDPQEVLPGSARLGQGNPGKGKIEFERKTFVQSSTRPGQGNPGKNLRDKEGGKGGRWVKVVNFYKALFLQMDSCYFKRKTKRRQRQREDKDKDRDRFYLNLYAVCVFCISKS